MFSDLQGVVLHLSYLRCHHLVNEYWNLIAPKVHGDFSKAKVPACRTSFASDHRRNYA